MRRISVVVADGEPGGCALCESVLRLENDISIVAQTEQHAEAIVATVHFKPHILLCSLRLAATAGYALLTTLQQRAPATLNLLWADNAVDDNQIIAALAHGALGFLNRNDLPRQLAKAIRGIAEGEAWVPRKMLGTIVERLVT